ncbi:hypothetical protein B9Z65_7663 [Elsinoe australis]|uniref:NAD(P)-binding protein n=1 Tax=Elsinoe australis TaxID=40998 RepID=A0A2P8A073_9PEZI|nr:hypothetical protein B9Z65_7663 [Elsinoe australis]
MSPPTSFYQPYADLHKDPQGEGDARPTAMKIIEDQGLINKWSDKVVLITGTNVGIGTETARALHATGAKVFVTARTKAKVEPVVTDILSTSPSKVPIEIIEMDLSSLSSIRKAASDFLSRTSQLNVLVNNAGIMACPQSKTSDGFELQLGTNHLGHFLFFQLLAPTLVQSSTPSFASRVINVSSSGHGMAAPDFDNLHFQKPNSYSPFAAYGASKTANIWFSNEIERRYAQEGLHSISLHPGVIFQTGLTRNLAPGAMDGLDVSKWEKLIKSVQQGAATQVWAATAKELEGQGGFYVADCGVSKPIAEGEEVGGSTYAPHAYNEEGERKLWEVSCEAVGVGKV